ncbi:MAG: vanadium-dependent haloperoxidase [Saprospiraceae bacterium]|nr:vanadium-dependent haloperoxidase [Saprospiraceae bacterium]
MNRLFLVLLVFSTLFVACEPDSTEWSAQTENPDFLHQSMKKLTDVIVHDIFSPPVASRIYAYPSIAAYEVLRLNHPDYRSLAGQLNGLTAIPAPEAGKTYCYSLASVHAFLTVGRNMIFSEQKIEGFQNELYQQYADAGVPESVIERSKAYGEAVAAHIMAWSDGDNYKQTRTFPKFTIMDEPSRWQPTPPDYMDGIEPHWKEIRPFVIKSSDQFVPPPPTEFSMKPGSQFYNEAMEVYEVMKTEEKDDRMEIAKFWDCNPYVSTHAGHVMFASKKITPGGHWIGITQLAAKKANSDMMETAQAYALVSISLADAFISCWDEKYRSNLIRPETVINVYVDEDWRPALQTPPFPEYTSGHSVISRSAAIALTSLYGDNFKFVDTVEEEYGLTVRSFNSFLEASSEAAVSRLYGGIHYRPAIDNGVAQGEKVGKFIVETIIWKSNTAIGMKTSD